MSAHEKEEIEIAAAPASPQLPRPDLALERDGLAYRLAVITADRDAIEKERDTLRAQLERAVELLRGCHTGDLFGPDGYELVDVFLSAIAEPADHIRGAAQMVGWIKCSERMPEHGKPVLANYRNSHGMSRTIRAKYVEAWTEQAEDSADPDVQCVEYSEQDDAYYLLAGWYELIDNWDEYACVAVAEGVITRWHPMPPPPRESGQ